MVIFVDTLHISIMNHTVDNISLLKAIQNDDEVSFDTLFRNYYPALVAYANLFIELEDSESIVQDLMVWLWENRKSITIESSLSSYLFRSTYNRVLNAITKKEIEKKAISNFYIQQLEQIKDFDLFELRILIEKIEDAIKELPDNYREAFIMHRFKDMTYKEIANELAISPKTVDYRIQHALKLLRVKLKDYIPLISTVIPHLL